MSDFNVTVSQDTIKVSVPQQVALSFTSAGAGSSVISSTVNSNVAFKSFVAGAGITIDDNGNELTLTAGGLGAITTDDVTEGTNLYFTEQRVDDAIADAVSTAALTITGGVGSQGLITWNADEETLDVVQNGATLQLGQETQVHVRNNTLTTIPNGTAVMATGTLGASGRITIAPMIADGSIEPMYYLGITTEDIDAGTDGKVTVFGKVRHIDTSAFLEGSVLWVDPTVPGGLTTTSPTAPNLKLPTAYVIHSATNGTIYVRANSGIDLHNNHRVEVNALAEGDLLSWNNTLTRWENKTFAQLGLNTTNWDTAYSWGDHNAAGYLTNYTETDPIFTASAAAGITVSNISNWNTAYSWGDHSAAGYITSAPAFSIFDATDVNQSDPALLEGQVLAYNEVAGEFGQRYLTTDDISDIVVTTVTNGEVLVYDNVSSSWKNKTLANADIASAFDLQTNYVSNTSLNQTLTGYATDAELTQALASQNIADHADVFLASGPLAEGQALIYSVAAGNKWVNASITSDNIPEGSTNLYFTDARVNDRDLDAFNDVTYVNIGPDDVLVRNATGEWQNLNPVVHYELLDNVNVTTPVQGDTLVYNETSGKWENSAPTASAPEILHPMLLAGM